MLDHAKERVKSLEMLAEQSLANHNALLGSVAEARYFLSCLEAEAAKNDATIPPANEPPHDNSDVANVAVGENHPDNCENDEPLSENP